MKKYFFLFLLLSAFGFFYFYNPFKASVESTIITEKSRYVSLSDNIFKVNDKPFYPVCLNYIVGLQTDRKNLWPCPSKSYNPDNGQFFSTDSKNSFNELLADMQLIKDMGFNSVRIVGIGDVGISDEATQELYIRPSIGNEKDTTILLSDTGIYEKYLTALESVIKAVDSAGLKVIILTNTRIGIINTETHLKKIVSRFKNNPTILAYDLFNEPLYFDLTDREKPFVYQQVKRWNKIVKNNAPYHLTTIGLEGIREVFEWDPNILPVDFISLHPYEYEPEQVRNEIYWYAKYIKKPWMIGETGIPADNDSVTYQEQFLFAQKTLEQTLNCNSWGYSWWQYKDVEWNKYHANYLGLVTREGDTLNSHNIKVKGKIKTTAKAFQEFNFKNKKDSCKCLSNYYNYSNGNVFKLTGKMVDDKNNPIEGGVVLGWNEHWSSSYHTITKKDGSFELLGDFIFYHWMASATEYKMVRGEVPLSKKVKKDSIPSVDLGVLKISKAPIIY